MKKLIATLTMFLFLYSALGIDPETFQKSQLAVQQGDKTKMVDVLLVFEEDRLLITNKKKTEVLKTFGRIDVLINNVGITGDAQLVKMTSELFDNVNDVNLKGTFNCTKAVATSMIQRARGKIINVSSVVGIFGNFGQTNYAASKFGVIGMTKTWAKELGRKNINVNAVAPGFILTEMTRSMPDNILNRMKEKSPLNKLGTPEDVANVFIFIASDESDFIHGTVISVDGGVVL